jgi:formamidopyrimidine-DNA glycosylase
MESFGEKSLDVILMDQKMLVSGIGNIIKSEMLYDAKISPKRKGKEVSDQEWKRILQSGKRISKKVLSNLEKEKDEFQGILRVYEMEKDPKGNPVSDFRSKDGRSTYWVPNIQN